MPTLVAITPDALSRQVIRASLPAGWESHEASDGVQGLALVRQVANAIDLLLVASELSHLDGRLVCLQLRALCPTVPLIPIADAGGTVPFLIEIGCLPPLAPPLAVDDVRARIATARTMEAPPAPASAFVQTTVCERFVPGGLAMLRGAVLRDVTSSGIVERTVRDADDYLQVVRDRFALDVPEMRALWPAVWARHRAWEAAQ